MSGAVSFRYPLEWPAGYEPTPPGERRRSGGFSVAWKAAQKHIVNEVAAVQGLVAGVITQNRRDDGGSPGAAVYLYLEGDHELALACDTFMDRRDNLRALGLTIHSLRMIQRYGVGELTARAFMGFEMLPEPEAEEDPNSWWIVFDLELDATFDEVKAAYRREVDRWHPDKPDGDEERFRAVREAFEKAKLDFNQ